MKGWAKQIAAAAAVLVLGLAVGGLSLLLREQQNGLASSMAAAGVRLVSPADGATNQPLAGDIRADYGARPSTDPLFKLEPPIGVSLTNGRWEGTTFVIHYSGLSRNRLYHVELDQDSSSRKGEHQQIKLRWSFQTGSGEPPAVSPAVPTSSPRASGSPSPTASPSATASPVTPPPSGPLIWYHDPYNALHAVDWNGRTVVSDLTTSAAQQSPEGAYLWHPSWRQSGDPPAGTVTTSGGNVVGTVLPLQQMMWADDGTGFCGIGQSVSGVYELDLFSLDGSRRVVAPIGLPTAPAQTPALLACSPLSGRAVIMATSSTYIWSVSMISLSDGSVIYQHRYPNPLARLVASHDGQFLAEQLAGNVSGGPYTWFRELPSGNQFSQPNGTPVQLRGIAVQGFSWDGALVAGSASGTGTAPEIRVIKWRTGQVVWRICPCPMPSSLHVLAEPGGTRLAIIAGWNHDLDASFTIIDSSGSAKSVPIGQTPLTPAF